MQHFFMKRNIPAFTLPFVLVTWLILFVSRHYFPEFMVEMPTTEITSSDSIWFAVRGFGQVIFQDNLVSGTLFFIAVFISSPIHALYGLAGGILSAILSLYFSVSIEDIGMGLLSYNAVLCAIVFAGTQIKDGMWVLVSVVLSLTISLLMGQYQLTQLTFPFVLASCVTVVLKNNVTGKSSA
jgi:urea transporter